MRAEPSKMAICEPESGPLPDTKFVDTLILDFSPSELWEIPVVYTLPSLWYLVLTFQTG